MDKENESRYLNMVCVVMSVDPPAAWEVEKKNR